ncbi:MAG: hypothetical protein ACE5GJ_00990 [Gemmatimonadota bacterium]
MNEELHRHLDGELPGELLDDDTRREAEAWERLLEGFREELPAVKAPPWLETRIMAEIEALPQPGVLRRAWAWLLRPRPVRVSPLTAGLAVAAVAALILRVGGAPERTRLVGPGAGGQPSASPSTAGTQPPAATPVIYVEFRLTAPGARSVAVAGDFDNWTGRPLSDPDGDGVWTGRIPVRPGVHAYMFVVDENQWVTDPEAELYADDGFGNRNAVLAVSPPDGAQS